MKIISWNINGLNASIKKGLIEFIKSKSDVDIFCFQETKLQHTACPNCGKYNGRQILNMQKDMDKITKVKA